ncbi:MAG: FtsX-like permease family protein [Bacteroidaceae bacterium]|nr:FtsX-like permease family protein [Bacteroidaceae bacterium]
MRSYFRFLSRNKLYTLINVAGLVVSLMFIILMGDYAWRQFSIDRWHKNADRIYVMGSEEDFFMWPQAARDIQGMCPEVEQTCCVLSQSGRIKYGEQEVKTWGDDMSIIMMADSTFFSFFDFKLIDGNPKTALDAPDKCVITERLAKCLFGEKNPIGEPLQIVGDRHVRMNNVEDPYDSTQVYIVSAVAKDFDRTVLPNETQIIVRMERYPQVMGYKLTNDVFACGASGPCKAFVMLRPGTTFDAKKKVVEDYLTKNYILWHHQGEHQFTMTPLTEVMFAPQNEGYGLLKGDKTRLNILLAAVLAILFFAVSNYINLTVANTGFRAKEMATRKLFGSSQHEISLKLIAESTLMVAVSFAIGLCLALCFQDDAAELFRGKISLINDINLGTVSVSLGFILLVGIVSGVMPSWQISQYQPIDIVKGNFRFRSKMVLGKIFIILQNVITVTMLSSALVIWLQLNHLINAPMGYNIEHLYYVFSPEGKAQTLRNQLEKMPFVEQIGSFRGTTFCNYNSTMRSCKRNEKIVNFYLASFDSTAFKLLGLKILRDYGPASDGYYLSEEGMRQMEYTEHDREMDWGEGKKKPIAGVIKDFHHVNVLSGYDPFAIRISEDIERPNFLVKTNGDKRAEAAFRDALRKLGTSEDELEWHVSCIADEIAESFEDQQNTLKSITLFSIVAIVISVMGFVGMSLFFIRQRKKEIGIRKIMGGTSREVVALMLGTFCAPLLVSFVIAVPLAWYIMNDWLSNFSYRIALSPWMFAATCTFALVVAVLSVGIQIVKAVRTNPVESIKTE